MQLSVFFFLPSLLLSGFMFPFRGMPVWAQYIGEVLPLTHYLRFVRGVLLKGNGLAESMQFMWPIVIFWIVVVAIGFKFTGGLWTKGEKHETFLKVSTILVIAFVASAFSERHCQAREQTVTLSQTLKAAFRQNPSIEASRYQVAALEAMVDQSASAYFPQVSNMTNYYRVGGICRTCWEGWPGIFPVDPEIPAFRI